MDNNVKNFYDKAPVGICAVRRDRKRMDVLYANPAFRRMAGQGTTIEDLLSSDDGDAFIRKLKSTTPPSDYILPVSGGWAKLVVQQAAFEGQDAFILWATDISSLQKAVADADAAAGMKANFLATMSHEIRTPMQSVYGLLELIGEEKPDEKIKTMVDTAKTSASGLLEILDDVLDFAKMDADQMELDTFEVPVRTLVRGINEALAVKIHGQSVKLLDDIAQDVPFVVIGDPKRLRQIIMNLTGNALKFTKDGSVTVRVTRKPAARGLTLRFEIVDTGIGMKPEVCAKLFQPFTQGDNTTARKYGGTGLGLSISKKLVELMGGDIGVESTEGKGSVFWFEIPTEEVGTETTTIDLPALDGISVLSVEDHPQGAKEIVRSLQSMGAKVESCPTYKEALELVRRLPFDVGIIDQGLPDGLGLDLIREIMTIRPFMGLIMYTVRDDIGLQYSLNALGVTYLTKPASRRGLGEAVKDSARKIVRAGIDGPTRLLIAEDTASVRDVLKRQLDKLAVAADFVENGAEALAALKTGKYGILFTDLHMPDIDGYQVIKTIRENGSTLPVIALTADVRMTQRQIYLSHGFDECLLKPVSLGQFRRLLARWGLLEETADDTDAPSTSATKPSGGAVDLEKLKEQMGVFDDSVLEMLALFPGMTAPLVEKMREALSRNDRHQLKETAHSLKGAARSACCNDLGDAAAQLQDEAENNGPNCATLVEKVEKEFVRATDAIKSLTTDN